MRLELKDIKDGSLRETLSYPVSDFPVLAEMEQRGEIGFGDPLRFELRFQKAGQLVEVDGHFETRVTLGCSRCLQDYTTELAGDFALTFTPYAEEQHAERDEEEEVELEADELGLVYYRDEVLELLPPLQDQLVMALPISPLCSDSCAGLCPECGCNLNEERCSCEKKVFNNKFSALAGLKIEPSED